MTDPMELVGRLEGEPGDCPFCGRDPYHYVDNGVGVERVAVTCCDEGVSLFQHGDPVLAEQVSLRREAAACIREMVEALRPLAIHADHYQHKPDSWGIGGTVANGLPTNRINVGHCRRAKALASPPAPGAEDE